MGFSLVLLPTNERFTTHLVFLYGWVGFNICPDHHIFGYSWKMSWLGLTAGGTDEHHFKMDIF